MNERIRELSKQAWAWAEQQEYTDPTKEFSDILEAKFAELIVKECGYYADIFEAAGCPIDMDPTETKPSDYIKKHFGVEE